MSGLIEVFLQNYFLLLYLFFFVLHQSQAVVNHLVFRILHFWCSIGIVELIFELVNFFELADHVGMNPDHAVVRDQLLKIVEAEAKVLLSIEYGRKVLIWEVNAPEEGPRGFLNLLHFVGQYLKGFLVVGKS